MIRPPLLYLLLLLGTISGTYSHADVIDPESWVSIPDNTDPLLNNLTIPDDAPTKGMWSAVYSWPFNGLHSILLPDGRVLSFGTNPNGVFQDGRYFDVWDPELGLGSESHNTDYDSNRQDSFCAAAVYLDDGSMLISGGNGSETSTLYDAATHTTMTDPSSLAEARWYATIITLPDGRPIILGGMVPYTEDMRLNPDQALASGWPSMTPEVYENGQWRSLFGAYSRLAFGPDYLRTSYPRAWVAPDGRIFGISAEQMWYLDPNATSGNGELVSAGAFKTPYSFSGPVNVGATSSAVMYEPGKILQVGGNGGFNEDELPASNMATVIDINSNSPVIGEQGTMTHARRYPNTIVLPNGKVLVTGGATYGNNYLGQPALPVYAAEIWNPLIGNWQVAASAARYRGYHSITSLLTNGTVLSTGGGTPGPVTNLNAEIYYPPYLFRTVDEHAEMNSRPVIQAISGLAYPNEAPMQLDMHLDAPISGLVLMGTSNGTHSFNSGQRRIPLAFTQEKFRLTTTLPNNFIAPPGYYQVIALNATGVPSKGVIIGIGQDQASPPITPIPYNPPDLDENIATPEIQAGETATYSVNAIAGTLYNWHFSDTNTNTTFTGNPEVTHVFAEAGAYVVTLTAEAADGAVARRSFIQAVSTNKTAFMPQTSSQIVIEGEGADERVWAVNPDNDSVAVIASNNLLAEITVGESPRSVAIAPDGRVWVTNKKSASISILDAQSLGLVETINLPRASQPHGLAFSPNGIDAYVVLEASGTLLKLDAADATILQSLDVGQNARHVTINSDSSQILVTRFITPPLPGEAGAIIDTSNSGAEVLVVDAASLIIEKTIRLAHSAKADTETSGSGIPNYLAAAVISPDGTQAWIPSKQDNIKRGILRNGLDLNFQNSVRAISSRIDMSALTEDYSKRIDHDNSGVGSAAAFHPNGVYLFVALETSRDVAVLDGIRGSELFKIDVGLAPQGLAISKDGLRLYVKEFMARSIRVINLEKLLRYGELSTELEAVVTSVQNEKLNADVLAGKISFYDAKNPRLARDSYLSCASCHNDGGQDGRVWDFSGFGEGLRNTIALNGRGSSAHGLLHWTGNFDEVQDFEKQIRDFAGGTGLMDDADFNSGSRSSPLGDAKAGISAELDQLASYLASLQTFAPSVFLNEDGSLTNEAEEGRVIFKNQCTDCHGGDAFSISSDENALRDIGSVSDASGLRLGAEIIGLDVPTLRDAWQTAPYLHNGSAATLREAVQAHLDINLTAVELDKVVAYVKQLSREPGQNSEPQVPEEEDPPIIPEPGDGNGNNHSSGGSSGGGSNTFEVFFLLWAVFLFTKLKQKRY